MQVPTAVPSHPPISSPALVTCGLSVCAPPSWPTASQEFLPSHTHHACFPHSLFNLTGLSSAFFYSSILWPFFLTFLNLLLLNSSSHFYHQSFKLLFKRFIVTLHISEHWQSLFPFPSSLSFQPIAFHFHWLFLCLLACPPPHSAFPFVSEQHHESHYGDIHQALHMEGSMEEEGLAGHRGPKHSHGQRAFTRSRSPQQQWLHDLVILLFQGAKQNQLVPGYLVHFPNTPH